MTQSPQPAFSVEEIARDLANSLRQAADGGDGGGGTGCSSSSCSQAVAERLSRLVAANEAEKALGLRRPGG